MKKESIKKLNKREGRIIDQGFKIRQMHKKTENKLEAGEAELESCAT